MAYFTPHLLPELEFDMDRYNRYNRTNSKRSMFHSLTRGGDLRRSTTGCWRRMRFSASSRARRANHNRIASSKLGQKRDHRPLHYHTSSCASSRIRFSGGTSAAHAVRLEVADSNVGGSVGARSRPFSSREPVSRPPVFAAGPSPASRQQRDEFRVAQWFTSSNPHTPDCIAVAAGFFIRIQSRSQAKFCRPSTHLFSPKFSRPADSYRASRSADLLNNRYTNG
jgi:hypothetical protein